MNILALLVENKLEYLVKAQGPKLEQRAQEDTRKQMAAVDVVEHLAAADPTGNQHKFLQWIVNIYLRGGFKLEDVNRIKNELAEFVRVRAKLEKKDINQYKALPELYAALEPFKEVDVVSNRQADKSEGQRFFADGEAVMLVDTNNVKIIELKSKAASQYFGRGTRWCTAATEDCMFDRYHSEGPLYVVIEGGQKYQFHFETGSFMDAQDSPISEEKFRHMYNTAPISGLFKSREEALADQFIENAGSGANHHESEQKIEEYLGAISDRYEMEPKYLMDKMLHAELWILNSLVVGTDLIGKQWPAYEKRILAEVETPDAIDGAYKYARDLIEGPWPEFEAAIEPKLERVVTDRDAWSNLLQYCTYVKQHRWEELERALLANMPTAVNFAIQYAQATHMRRWPEIEEYAKQMPHTAFDYAVTVLGRPWPEAEDVIMSGAFTKDKYAQFKAVMDRRK